MSLRVVDWLIVHATTCMLLGQIDATTPRTLAGGIPTSIVITMLLLIAGGCWVVCSSRLAGFGAEALACVVGLSLTGLIIALIAVVLDLAYYDVVKIMPLAGAALLLPSLALQWMRTRRLPTDMHTPRRDLLVALSVQAVAIVFCLVRRRIYAWTGVPEFVRVLLLEMIFTYPVLLYFRAGRDFVHRRINNN